MPEPLKTIFTYPWDLDDEGIERALDVIQKDAGLNGVSLTPAYHISTYFLPHNPRRKIYYGEDGMILFQPDESRWAKTKLRPRVSHLVQNRDWLPRMAEAIKKRGLHLTAWTVYFYNHHLARTFPEVSKQDALGNRYPSLICPANPEARAYALALTDDIMRQLRPDSMYIESLSYLHFGYGFMNPKIFSPIAPRHEFLLGLCFCEHCVKAAARGLDAVKFRSDVAAYLETELPKIPSPADLKLSPNSPDWQNAAFDSRLQHYLNARMETATSLYEETVRLIKSFGAVPIETEFPSPGNRVRQGLVPERLLKILDRVTVGVPERAESVQAQRKNVPAGMKLLANFQPLHLPSREAAIKAVQGARAAGVDGFSFYNYGLLRMEQLRWIGEANRAAGN